MRVLGSSLAWPTLSWFGEHHTEHRDHPQQLQHCAAPIEVAFGVDKQGRPIHLQKSGLASHRFAQMYSFAGQNVP